jgi:class 3 adenylate cyclase
VAGTSLGHRRGADELIKIRLAKTRNYFKMTHSLCIKPIKAILMPSQLLDRIYDHQNRTLNAKVVFADIVSYSKRRSQMQAEVVDGFVRSLKKALESTASKLISYIQSNEINFNTDVIRIPSGDGAAIVFAFDGLNDVHLSFALNLLKAIEELNKEGSCDKFKEQKWCNCHPFFQITLGIAEGKVVLYKDLNGNYNVAGNAINMAARVMKLADPNQIILTEDAYRQLIALVNDPTLGDKFLEFKNAPIKHGSKINVYQYIDTSESYLNSAPIGSLMAMQRMNKTVLKMQSLGLPFPFPLPDASNFNIDVNAFLSSMEGMAKIFEMGKTTDAISDIPVVNLPQPTIGELGDKAKGQKRTGKRKQ